MAAVAQPGPTPTPMQTDPQASGGADPGISWEGDKMFNIYIYDYCSKRGFKKTARELLVEAELAPDSTPPINARQGLLFEWWSVFWVLFQAKSNSGNSEDALLYIQHQTAQRQAGQRIPQAVAPLPVTTQAPQQPPAQQQQPPIGRMANGIQGGPMPQGLQRPPSAYPGNNTMANGVVGQPGQSMQGQTSMNFVSVGPAPGQANGIQGGPSQQQGGPPPSGVQAPGMPFNTMMPGNQRPPPNGLAPSQQPQPGARGPNPNGGPFQSPTMAHSPQNNAGGPSQQHQPGPGQQQAPMAQLGPSPHMAPMNMNRGSVVGGHGMLPPNGGPPPSMGPPTPQGGGPPTPGYAPGNQGGRPPSRTNTPRSGMMTHPSPSMGARQTPGGGGGPGGPQGGGMGGMMGLSQGGMGMMGMPGMTGMQSMGGPSGMSGMPMDGSGLNHEIMQIPLMNLNSIKQELGYGAKELGALDIQEKSRIVGLWRQRGGHGQQMKPGPPGPPGMMPGQHQPGNMQQRPGGLQQPQQMGQQQMGQPQRVKRSSTSPGEEHETLPRNESSPPERKRAKRESEPPTMPPMSYGHPGQPGSSQSQQQQPPNQHLGHPGPAPSPHQQPPPHQQQPGQPPNPGPPGQPGPGQMSNQMMMHQRQMVNGAGGASLPPGVPGGHPGHPGGPPGQGPMPGTGQPTFIHPQQMLPYRQQQGGQMGKPGGMNPLGSQGPSDHPFNPAGGPPGAAGQGGAQFSTTPLVRLGQKPTLVGMLPPPSPAMNGPPKDGQPGGGPGKDVKSVMPNGQPPPPQQPGQQTHNPNGSPRNVPPGGGPGGNGTAPPTPVPSNLSTPSQQPSQVPPPTPVQQPPPPPQQNSLGGSMMNTMMGMPMGMGGDIADLGMFGQSFMNMEDLDMFKPEGDINFEREFGQWFNGPEDGGGSGLESMK